MLAELVPGGLASEITAARAEAIIGRAPAGDPVAAARRDLAAELLAGLRHVDELICEPKKKLAAAVKAPGTSVTGLSGAGPVVAAIAVSDAAGVSRFATRYRFAAWNGTAPVEVSSGERKIHRLSLRGNRRVNYAIHVAAVTQTRHKHGPGRGFDLDASERVDWASGGAQIRHSVVSVSAGLCGDPPSDDKPSGQPASMLVGLERFLR